MSTKAIYELDAELRDVKGKGASRRLRREQNRVPAIVYGGNEPPALISLDHLKVLHALEHEGFYSHLLNLNFKGKKQHVILKDIHRHHFKKAVMHMDFLRVKATDIIEMRVPLHFMGALDAPGVKDSGGIINHHMSDLLVSCEARALPEFIEVDIANMVLDQIIHISDLKLPKGVSSVALNHGKEHDHAVISIHLPRVALEETEEAPELSEEEADSDETLAAEAKPAATPEAKTDNKGKGKGK